ncbi:MAG: thiamine pyrophosphate-requiring protein [Desulfobacterales bacterium]
MNHISSASTVAEAYLELLASRGIKYFFGNSGTDFAPIIEAFAKRSANGNDSIIPITVPHEITAVAMAHGYTMITGKPQVVMVHVIAGTANALGGIINAAKIRVPMFFTAGRTPLTEQGPVGTRDLGIHWAQESFDQATMVREFVKWDYELRLASQLETVVDRALAIAQSEPFGPVYLTLPREVLAENITDFQYAQTSRITSAAATVPDADTIRKTAEIIASARNPVAVVQSLGRQPKAVEALVELAETIGLPVIEQWHTHLNFPQDHYLHAGYDPSPYLQEADLILVIEANAPWFPSLSAPRPETPVIQIGIDPLFSDYPLRGFASDITLPGIPRHTLLALKECLQSIGLDAAGINARCKLWRQRNLEQRKSWQAKTESIQNSHPIDMGWVSACIGQRLDDRTIVINEYDLDTTKTCFTRPGSYFRHSPAASLGWGTGAALGAKLAKPDHKVICCVGDGAYIFGVPVAVHHVARANRLPVLFIVFNNGYWNASRQTAFNFAPDGYAVKAKSVPLCEIKPSLDYEKICQAAGGYGERVTNAADLPAAIDRALAVIESENRQALLNVICR